MDLDLTPEQNTAIRNAISAGRVEDTAQAVREAIALWVDRERRRNDLLSSLVAEEAALARGEGTAITPDAMKDLTAEVMRRCAVRLQQT
jgi:Arc/MetJ-type ribon-helix-helix transcriptional regulator